MALKSSILSSFTLRFSLNHHNYHLVISLCPSAVASERTVTHRLKMTSNIVKCSHCNIVICEVLAFIQNKIDVMNEESLVRLCTTSFGPEDIESAKSLLFESITTARRKITRKKEGRSQRDLYDIISLLKETDPDLVPIFVARDLQKLPPVHFDHIDPTRLLKDVLVLQKELNMIKESYVTEEKFNEVKYEVMNLKHASIVNNNFECNVNGRRGGGIITNSYFMDSGPVGLPPFSHAEQNISHSQRPESARVTGIAAAASPPRPASVSSPLATSPVQQVVERVEAPASCTAVSKVAPQPALALVQQVVAHVEANENCTAVSNIRTPPASCCASELPARINAHGITSTRRQVTSTPTAAVDKVFADVISREGQWKTENPNEQWIVAQRKRLRNRFNVLEGKAQNNINEKFKAADIRVPLFVNNVDSNTSENDIIEYILGKTQVRVSLQKIKAKLQRQYNAYKVYVPSTKLSLFFEDGLWPEGITVRKFIEFKYKTYGTQNRQESK